MKGWSRLRPQSLSSGATAALVAVCLLAATPLADARPTTVGATLVIHAPYVRGDFNLPGTSANITFDCASATVKPTPPFNATTGEGMVSTSGAAAACGSSSGSQVVQSAGFAFVLPLPGRLGPSEVRVQLIVVTTANWSINTGSCALPSSLVPTGVCEAIASISESGGVQLEDRAEHRLVGPSPAATNLPSGSSGVIIDCVSATSCTNISGGGVGGSLHTTSFVSIYFDYSFNTTHTYLLYVVIGGELGVIGGGYPAAAQTGSWAGGSLSMKVELSSIAFF